ncbi:MAG: TolC family protein [Paludibacteraceae bacterium]
MKRIKYLTYIFLLSFFSFTVRAQLITIDECQDLARMNFPLTKQQGLIDQSTETTISALMTQYFPQFRLNGQASYQSDVTRVDITLPDGFPEINIPIPDKDQYKVYLDISQTVFGGSSLGVQQQMTRVQAEERKQQVEIELYKLEKQINQIFFGILLADEQLKQTEILKSDLNSALEKVDVLVKNGISLETNRLNLEAELITLNDNIQSIGIGRTALVDVLEKLTGKELQENVQPVKPSKANTETGIDRPELTLIDYQKNTLSLQNRQLTAMNVPNISLFLQGGWGKPALNMFSNKFEPFYVGGVRFYWNISQLYTLAQDKRNIETRQKMYDVEKEIFQLNNEVEQTRQQSKISQLQSALLSDEKLIVLRCKIKKTSQIQLENGVITSAEFIRDANAENQARQTKALHEIQLLSAEYDLRWIGKTQTR